MAKKPNPFEKKPGKPGDKKAPPFGKAPMKGPMKKK
jgi:hypothetical protein